MALGTSGDNSIPSAPEITIYETTVVMDSTTALWHAEVFSLGDTGSGAGLQITLAHTPQSSANVLVFRNANVQRPTTDYSITGPVITLVDVMNSNDQVLVWYMALVP